ncbi:hypothetical protein STEG23_024413, partial [Scotinomys teguina]
KLLRDKHMSKTEQESLFKYEWKPVAAELDIKASNTYTLDEYEPIVMNLEPFTQCPICSEKPFVHSSSGKLNMVPLQMDSSNSSFTACEEPLDFSSSPGIPHWNPPSPACLLRHDLLQTYMVVYSSLSMA